MTDQTKPDLKTELQKALHHLKCAQLLLPEQSLPLIKALLNDVISDTYTLSVCAEAKNE